MVASLPLEILHVIVGQLAVRDLLTVRRVNSTLRAIATPLAASKGRVFFHSEKRVLDFVNYIELGNANLPLQNAEFNIEEPIKTTLMARFCRALASCRKVDIDFGESEFINNDPSLREMFLVLNMLPSLEGLIFNFVYDGFYINDLECLLPARLKRLNLGGFQSNTSGFGALLNISKRLPMLQELKMTILDGRMNGQHLVQWMADSQITWHQPNLKSLDLKVYSEDDGGALFPYVILVFLLTSFQLHTLHVQLYGDATNTTVHHPAILPRLPSFLVMNLPNSLSFSGMFPGADVAEQSQIRSLFSGLTIQGILHNVGLDASILNCLLNLLSMSSVRSATTSYEEPNRTGLLATFLERAQNLSSMGIWCKSGIQFDQDEIASWVREERRFSLQNLRFWRLHVQCLSSLESLAEVCPNLHSLSIQDLRVDSYSYTPIMLENDWMQMLVTMFAGSVPWISLPFRNLHLKYYFMEHKRDTLHIVLQDQRFSALPLQLYFCRFFKYGLERGEKHKYVKVRTSDVEWFKKQLHRWSKGCMNPSTFEIDCPPTFPSAAARYIFKLIQSNDLAILSCKSLVSLDAL
ncbi:hypothetical protein BC940DRAFT_313037 [Gongronella butleri]|nr:hypothetical protein BC940DRAFT_313037 [Gongronella butleri]